MPDSNTPRVGNGPLARLRAAGAYDRFARRAELPMLVLSVVFLGVLVLPVLDDRLTPRWVNALAVADAVIWAIFAAEYLVRLVLAPQRRQFVLRNIPDLLVVVVPVLRPLRLARLTRFVQGGALIARSAKHGGALHLRVAAQTIAAAVLVLFVGSVGILDVERDASGANIRTFGDAAWWAISTVTTVGYGDRYPVTAQGRLIGAGVMLTGIAVLGVITASIASWFVENLHTIRRAETEQASQQQRLEADLAEVLRRLARLETHLGTDPRSTGVDDGQS
jgi:voltage-gated potassium channel